MRCTKIYYLNRLSTISKVLSCFSVISYIISYLHHPVFYIKRFKIHIILFYKSAW